MPGLHGSYQLVEPHGWIVGLVPLRMDLLSVHGVYDPTVTVWASGVGSIRSALSMLGSPDCDACYIFR